MSIRYEDRHAVLDGHVAVEDAEALARWLGERTEPAVDLGAVEHVHAAVLQVLLALRPRLLAPPADAWLARALDAAGLPRD